MDDSPLYCGATSAPKVMLNARVDRDLRMRLSELAFIQNRTLSNLVETILKRALREESFGELLPCEIDDGK